MPLDEHLVDHLRAALSATPGVDERRMFGGVGFLLDGHLAVCASGQGGLMARVDPRDGERLLAEDGVEPMVMRGGPVRGWLRVTSDAVATEPALRAWVDRSIAFVRTLGPKR